MIGQLPTLLRFGIEGPVLSGMKGTAMVHLLGSTMF